VRPVATNLFIAGLLCVLVIDALPPAGTWHQRLKDWIDPFTDVSGLWQGDWELFAPDVIKRSARMSADIECTHGVHLVWESPRLNTLPIVERFFRFRDGEYFDTIRNDASSGAWESLADYLARTEVARGAPGEHALSVQLWRHWWDVPPFGSRAPAAAEERFAIYHKAYPP
jgi:hypothetical protein